MVLTIVMLSVALGAFGCASAQPPGGDGQKPTVSSEKQARTPAQRKINSQLLYEIYRRRGEAAQKGVPPGPTDVKIDDAGRALVDVRVEVTPAMEKTIRDLGGIVISTSPRDQSIIARIPLLKLERLASEPSVRAIEPAAEAMTNRQPKG